MYSIVYKEVSQDVCSYFRASRKYQGTNGQESTSSSYGTCGGFAWQCNYPYSILAQRVAKHLLWLLRAFHLEWEEISWVIKYLGMLFFFIIIIVVLTCTLGHTANITFFHGNSCASCGFWQLSQAFRNWICMSWIYHTLYCNKVKPCFIV